MPHWGHHCGCPPWLFNELLGDFPFVDEASRAHTLALMLEPFVRPLIKGPTPLYLIDAPTRGGPGGNTVFLTNAPVVKPLQPFDNCDGRRLIENCCIKGSKQQWSLKHPPQKTARAVRVHVTFTLLMFALATAYRLQAEEDDLGKEPVGWQRWRR